MLPAGVCGGAMALLQWRLRTLWLKSPFVQVKLAPSRSSRATHREGSREQYAHRRRCREKHARDTAQFERHKGRQRKSACRASLPLINVDSVHHSTTLQKHSIIRVTCHTGTALGQPPSEWLSITEEQERVRLQVSALVVGRQCRARQWWDTSKKVKM